MRRRGKARLESVRLAVGDPDALVSPCKSLRDLFEQLQAEANLPMGSSQSAR